MKCVIHNRVVLLRVPEGPLSPYLNGFANAASTKGYAVRTIHHRVLLAAGFSQWLKQKGIEPCSITSDHPKQYLQYRYCLLRPSRGDRAALRHLIEFLRLDGVIPAEKTDVPQATEGRALCTRLRGVFTRNACFGHVNDRELRTIHTQISSTLFWQRTRYTLASLCQRCRGICSAPSKAFEKETSEDHDHCVTLFSKVRAL